MSSTSVLLHLRDVLDVHSDGDGDWLEGGKLELDVVLRQEHLLYLLVLRGGVVNSLNIAQVLPFLD